MKRPEVFVAKKGAVAPARRNLFSRLRVFFTDIYSELRKVIWPTREEAIRLTVMTLAVSVAVGVFLGVIDFGFTNLISYILSVGK